jgi:hypothetical protein
VNVPTPNTVYFYRVRAVGQDPGDTSAYSGVISLLAIDPPVADFATNITATGFTAHWSGVTGALGYVIDVARRQTFGGETHYGQTFWDLQVGNVTSVAVINQLPDSTYYYRVRATTAKGEGPSSNFIVVNRILNATPLPSITINVPFAKVFSGIGGSPAYTWSLAGGAFPAGLNISAAGVLSGTPTALGTFNFTLQMTDGNAVSVTKSFSIPVISTTTVRLDTATFNNVYGFNGSSVTWQHPIGTGNNRMLVVTVGGEDTSAAALASITVTYNGVAMTKATGTTVTAVGRTDISQIWYMYENSLPAAGSYNVVVSATSVVAGIDAGAMSFFNVVQGAPDAAVSVQDPSSENLTAPITTHANHAWLISDAVNGWSGNFFPVPNQESEYNMSGELDLLASVREVPVAGADSMLARHLVLYRMCHSVISLAPTSAGVNATAKVYLQGPYNTGTNAMDNSLRTGGQLAAHFGSMPIPVGAVDSITVEVRDSAAAAKASHRAFAPAWLLTDGSIRAFGDTTKGYVSLGSVLTGNYYIVIYHRNHLAVMSASPVALSGGTSPVAYDFSTGQAKAFGTTPMALAGTNYALISGDPNGDGLVNALDRVATRNNLGVGTYNAADVNLDGIVNALDRVVTRNNLGLASQVP